MASRSSSHRRIEAPARPGPGMNRLTIVIQALVFFFVSTIPASADVGASIISYGRTRAPGVKAEVMAVARPSVSRGGHSRATSGGASSSAAAPQIPTPISISAHNCIPRLDARGVPLDRQFFEGSVGDCISFVSPEPVPAGPKARGPRNDRRPSPQTLAHRAFERVISLAPSPDLDVAPARIGLTGLTSYFWVSNELRPVTATAGVRGLTVTAEARPARFRWEFGDGATRQTRHGGRPWMPSRRGNVGHLYETKGRYEPTVTVAWAARWRVNAGPWQDLGYFSTTGSTEYPVREMIAVLVRRR
jgi:hypothetical protein